MQPSKLLYRDYSATSSYTFGSYGPLLIGYGGIAIVDSSTSLVSASKNIGTFASLAAGDIIEIYPSATATPIRRKVVSVTISNDPAVADAIVVDAVVTLTAIAGAWAFRKASIGNAAGDGWMRVDDLPRGKTLFFSWTLLAGSFYYKIEGRGQGFDAINAPISILAEVTVSASGSKAIEITEDIFAIRLGVKGTASSPGNQKVDEAYIEGRQWRR
jgi:hypothetical protein